MIRKFAYQDRVRRLLLFGKGGAFRPGDTRTKGIFMSFAKTIALATLVALPAVAEVKPPLRDVKEIDNELYYIAIANEISEYCPSISGRRLKAISVMWGLRSKANKLGYSDTEIRSYIGSDVEKDRMRTKGEAYLAAHGVTYDTPDTFCMLGQKEIQRNSAIGAYMREK